MVNIEQIKHRANIYNKILNKPQRPDEKDIKIAAEHLRDCLKYPTTGLLARETYNTTTNPFKQTKNKKFLNSLPAIKQLNKFVDAHFNRLYPKTAKIRKLFIANDNISFDKVKPKNSGEIKHSILKLMLWF